MHIYKIKLRLGGSTSHEIMKTVTAPELLVMQFIHGDDSVLDVKEIKNLKIKNNLEKQRLRQHYDMALIKSEQSIDTIFGPMGVLPERLPDDLIERFGLDEEGLPLGADLDKNDSSEIDLQNLMDD